MSNSRLSVSYSSLAISVITLNSGYTLSLCDRTNSFLEKAGSAKGYNLLSYKGL